MPDAFFCTTDNYAMLCIKALTKLGYKIPKDVEVIGFGNLHYSRMFTPELTSVSQPSFFMGEKAAELILSKIKRGFYQENQSDELILPTKIIRRETTR
jgi:LacI family transcriptional regulator